MYAFATPSPIAGTFLSATKRASCAAIPSAPKWRACTDGVDAAVGESGNLRSRLQDVADNRRAQAERTNAALTAMSEQLSKLMAQVRADNGMPPVADPPARTVEPKQVDRAPPTTDVSSDNDDDSSGVSDEPYMDPKNFGYESTAGWQVLAESAELPENEGNVEFRIACDMNGCSLIEVKGDAPGPGVRQRFIQSGPGFRVGYDPESPKSFCGMCGNDHWLLALNYDEIRHFKRLCTSLQKKMDRIGRGEEEPPVKKPAVRRSGDGMFNMRVAKAGLDCSVELESKLVWVQAIGQPILGQYCIRSIFMEGRQSEGFWSMDTVPNMLAALNKLGIE